MRDAARKGLSMADLKPAAAGEFSKSWPDEDPGPLYILPEPEPAEKLWSDAARERRIAAAQLSWPLQPLSQPGRSAIVSGCRR
jgi:hypothetical protein